jgi:predicted nucleic acid-binding protein
MAPLRRSRKIPAYKGTSGRQLRIYADTSVIGGCFDAEFEQASRKLFERIQEGRFILVLSGTTLEELNQAPARVQQVVKALPQWAVERVFLTREMEMLRDACISAGVVEESSLYDAEHIACATVADVDVIVSWNFKHIVNFDRIRGYHAVNLFRGYHQVPIHTPAEVIEP